jgi:hypothetical protein
MDLTVIPTVTKLEYAAYIVCVISLAVLLLVLGAHGFPFPVPEETPATLPVEPFPE